MFYPFAFLSSSEVSTPLRQLKNLFTLVLWIWVNFNMLKDESVSKSCRVLSCFWLQEEFRILSCVTYAATFRKLGMEEIGLTSVECSPYSEQKLYLPFLI